MQCRSCGIEIAEKALICYKCGTATTEAKYQPVAVPGGTSSRRSAILSVVLLALLAVLAAYGSRKSAGDVSTSLRWAAVALAVATAGMGVRGWRRR